MGDEHVPQRTWGRCELKKRKRKEEIAPDPAARAELAFATVHCSVEHAPRLGLAFELPPLHRAVDPFPRYPGLLMDAISNAA